MKTLDLLDALDKDNRSGGDEAKLLEEIADSESESFDDHQKWMIESFLRPKR